MIGRDGAGNTIQNHTESPQQLIPMKERLQFACQKVRERCIGEQVPYESQHTFIQDRLPYVGETSNRTNVTNRISRKVDDNVLSHTVFKSVLSKTDVSGTKMYTRNQRRRPSKYKRQQNARELVKIYKEKRFETEVKESATKWKKCDERKEGNDGNESKRTNWEVVPYEEPPRDQ